MSYSSGMWRSTRYGVGSFYFDPAGSIGAFYFGPTEVNVTPDPLVITLSFITPTVDIGQSVNVVFNYAPLQITCEFHTPTVTAYKDVDVDFVGVPRNGYSPLTVDFSASYQTLNTIYAAYDIKEYHWYFDYDRDTSISATSTTYTTSHEYSGWPGKEFSVACEVVLEPRI